MGSRKVFLASILRGVMPREWGGGLAGGKVSNVVRKEEERSDGVTMSDAG